MPNTFLKPGLTGSASFIVSREHLAITIGSGIVEVLSTPMLINGMENAAMNAVEPYLEQGETTVGIYIETTHNAATPLGMKADFSATLTEISANGKILAFQVEARDEAGKIGGGIHRRAIVRKDSFEQKARAKAPKKAERS